MRRGWCFVSMLYDLDLIRYGGERAGVGCWVGECCGAVGWVACICAISVCMSGLGVDVGCGLRHDSAVGGGEGAGGCL